MAQWKEKRTQRQQREQVGIPQTHEHGKRSPHSLKIGYFRFISHMLLSLGESIRLHVHHVYASEHVIQIDH